MIVYELGVRSGKSLPLGESPLLGEVARSAGRVAVLAREKLSAQLTDEGPAFLIDLFSKEIESISYAFSSVSRNATEFGAISEMSAPHPPPQGAPLS